MAMDRLIGILSILLRQDKVTAPYLAEKFEVSRRTINRDIETLCRAGVPVMTIRGRDGGISIMEGYRLDRTLLTRGEMEAVLSGLSGLDSVSEDTKYRLLMEKLSADEQSAQPENGSLRIDLASWYKDSLPPKIGLIRSAIDRREKIHFRYFSPKGESDRVVEPYLLVFEWSSWYVWGYCEGKKDYRLFKLNRMRELGGTGENFDERRDRPSPDFTTERIFPEEIRAVILFEAQEQWRLMEEFGPDSYRKREDGRLLFEGGFTDQENLFQWVLSFGDRAELLKPAKLRPVLRKLLKRAEKRYQDE